MLLTKKFWLSVALLFPALAIVFLVVDAGADAGKQKRLERAKEGLEIAVVDCSVKVRPNEQFAAVSKPAIKLIAVRNEQESGQFVLSSDTTIPELAISVSDLKSSGKAIIHADKITLLEARQVLLTKPSDTLGAKGAWPDPLVPIQSSVHVQAGENVAIWVRTNIAADVIPGKYSGAITLKKGNNQVGVIALEVEVFNVALPPITTLPSLVGLDYEMIARYEEVDPNSPSFESELLPKYYQALRRNHVFPLFVYNAKPAYSDDGKGAVLDMTPFWKKIDIALGSDATSAPIGLPFTESWPVDTARFPLMSPEYKRRVVSYLTALATQLEQRNALSRSFIYLATADEPKSKSQIKRIREFADLLRQANPRLRLLQTVHAHCDDCAGNALEQLEHPSLLWSPNIAFFDGKAMKAGNILGFGLGAKPSGWTNAFSERMKTQQREVWLYFNSWTFLLSEPPAYPTLFIDHSGIEPRAAGWLAFRYGIAGLGHWNATYWRNVSNPWSQLPTGEGEGGTPADGVLLFPAKNSSSSTGQPDPKEPISTIRLEMMREGAEDHALLTLLRRNGKNELANELSNQMTHSMVDFERDPTKYQQAKRRMVEALAR